MKKILAVLLSVLMIGSMIACGGSTPSSQSNTAPDQEFKTGAEAIDSIGADGIDWNHMTMDELYEMAKSEGGVITVYSTTSDANTAVKKIKKEYPDLEFEYISCDTDTVQDKIETEYDTNNVNADVLMVKDASGAVYNELVLWDVVSIYYPATICSHIDPDLLKYGMPLYSTFNPWFYNTEMFPDGCPLTSWWDIVEGYNPDTKSYKDASGNNTQKWVVYTKDPTSPSYAALWAQLIIDSDALFAQYEEQYGEDLVITYNEELENAPGFMELPENNAGVELFYRFTQMFSTELSDGDAVANAVDESLNGPTLGLCSASKIDNSDRIFWVTGLSPYTAQDAASYSYVVNGCDNPAGARLFINFLMGGDDGQSGCYQTFDKLGHWSVRDDVVYEKSGIEKDSVGLKSADYEQVYANYPNVQAYWKLWSSKRK